MAVYNHVTWPANQSEHMSDFNGTTPMTRGSDGQQHFFNRLMKCILPEEDPKEFLINAEIVQVVLSILGFLGAVTSVAVTSSKKLRSSTSLYLTALGAYDALFTLVALISASLKLSGSSVPWLYSVCSCLWTFCVFTSAYVIICVTAERTLSVAWPYFMEKYRSSRLAIKLNIIIFVVGFLTIIPQILDEILNLSIVGNCERGPNDIQLTKFGLIYTFYIRVPVNFVIPFIIVFFMNVWFVCTLIVIRRARRKHEIVHLGFSRDGGTRPQPPPSGDEGLIRLVVSLSCWYSLCWFLPGLYYCYTLPRKEVFNFSLEIKIAACADILIIANAAVNSLFYFLLWRQFRLACVTSCRMCLCYLRHNDVLPVRIRSSELPLDITGSTLATSSSAPRIDMTTSTARKLS